MNTTLLSKKIKGRKFNRILCISDQHHPFQHPDMIDFLAALENKYKFDLIINGGDEVDKHGLNFHEKEPDLPSYSDELEQSIKALQPLYKLFPKMEVLDSNHGSLVLRKGKFAGLPARVFKTPGEILKAPRGWTWCRDITLNTELGPVFFTHGKTSAASKLSKNMAMNTVQFHFHSKFQINYWGSPMGLFWDAHAGCLVDDNSLAMAYNKTTMDRPVVGVLIIINGRPQLIPMHLNKVGKWTKRL